MLLDQYNKGRLDIKDFKMALQKINAHWGTLIGGGHPVRDDYVKRKFAQIDIDEKGYFTETDYKLALEWDRDLFQWFDFFENKTEMEVEENKISLRASRLGTIYEDDKSSSDSES